MTFLDKALQLSIKLKPSNSNQQYDVFSFVFDRNKLISVGTNNMLSTSYKAYKIGKQFKVRRLLAFPFRHAELDAISKLIGKHYISGREKIVVVRLGKKNQPLLAKPCTACQELLGAFNLNRVWYTNNQGFETL